MFFFYSVVFNFPVGLKHNLDLNYNLLLPLRTNFMKIMKSNMCKRLMFGFVEERESTRLLSGEGVPEVA